MSALATDEARRLTLPTGQARQEDESLATLREGLNEVLPPTLVGAAPEAAEVALSAGPQVVTTTTGTAIPTPGPATAAAGSVFAAALGSTASEAVASALCGWLERHPDKLARTWPAWFRPIIAWDCQPTVATLTEFSNGRNGYIRHVVDNKTPVFLTRYGRVVAAVVPLQEGAYENAVYPSSARRVRAERQARTGSGASEATLTPEQIEEILKAPMPSDEASRYGIDTSRWVELTSQPQEFLPEGEEDTSQTEEIPAEEEGAIHHGLNSNR